MYIGIRERLHLPCTLAQAGIRYMRHHDTGASCQDLFTCCHPGVDGLPDIDKNRITTLSDAPTLKQILQIIVDVVLLCRLRNVVGRSFKCKIISHILKGHGALQLYLLKSAKCNFDCFSIKQLQINFNGFGRRYCNVSVGVRSTLSEIRPLLLRFYYLIFTNFKCTALKSQIEKTLAMC